MCFRSVRNTNFARQFVCFSLGTPVFVFVFGCFAMSGRTTAHFEHRCAWVSRPVVTCFHSFAVSKLKSVSKTTLQHTLPPPPPLMFSKSIGDVGETRVHFEMIWCGFEVMGTRPSRPKIKVGIQVVWTRGVGGHSFIHWSQEQFHRQWKRTGFICVRACDVMYWFLSCKLWNLCYLAENSWIFLQVLFFENCLSWMTLRLDFFVRHEEIGEFLQIIAGFLELALSTRSATHMSLDY